MYVVYDSKAGIYNKPFYFINHSVAVRAARELLDEPQSEITKNPHDFAMFHVGEYDDETAQIKPSKVQEIIVKFHELKTLVEQTRAREAAQQQITTEEDAA